MEWAEDVRVRLLRGVPAGHDSSPSSGGSLNMAKKVVHTETEIERALAALAKNAGNAARAQRELTAAGHPVAYRTLADWKTRYAERYEDARRRYSKALEEQLAEEMTSEARENIEA